MFMIFCFYQVVFLWMHLQGIEHEFISYPYNHPPKNHRNFAFVGQSHLWNSEYCNRKKLWKKKWINYNILIIQIHNNIPWSLIHLEWLDTLKLLLLNIWMNICCISFSVDYFFLEDQILSNFLFKDMNARTLCHVVVSYF